ncbi:hypothetical protein ACF0H5_016117 [Mactra antiquata]
METKDSFIACPVCKTTHVSPAVPKKDGTFASTCVNCGHFFKFKSVAPYKSSVSFTVNGQAITVGNEYSPSTMLADYLRQSRVSMGTKVFCKQGGCGVCIVVAKMTLNPNDPPITVNLNSCLCPLFMCDGWEITTVEGIGSTKTTMNKVQSTLADYGGTQCGYCSSGHVMNMYGLMQKYPNMTKKDAEDYFEGNICRCTGYRPILDAMKSMVPDSNPDIEDLSNRLCKTTGKRCTSSGRNCEGQCSSRNDTRSIKMVFGDTQWNKPTSMTDLYAMLAQTRGQKCRLLGSNTGTGYFDQENISNFDVVIDISSIPDMYVNTYDAQTGTFTLGACCSLTDLMELFKTEAAKPTDNGNFDQLVKYLYRVASSPIRNRGTWAGNLMMKNKYPSFPSDVFNIMTVLGASLTTGQTAPEVISCDAFFKTDMTGKCLSKATFKGFGANDIVACFKVMPRSQNSLALVNGAFRCSVDKTNGYMVSGKPVISIGGISDSFYFIHVLGDAVAFQYRSGFEVLHDTRPLSSGVQTYDTNKQEWPLNEPLKKIEANIQCTGEAQYTDDLPAMPGQLYAKFVISTQANATVQSINTVEAMKVPGVVKVLTSFDIPAGAENDVSLPTLFTGPSEKEELFCSGKVMFCGQSLALVVAESQEATEKAAKLVTCTYNSIQTPLVSIDAAISAGSFAKKVMPDIVTGDPDQAINSAPHNINGSFHTPEQVHFHMETQATVCFPTEDGLEMVSTTQWPDSVQLAVHRVTGIPEKNIKVSVKRLGGAYGGKITKNNIVAAACGLAAKLTNRPVRMRLSISDNLLMCGRRFPHRFDYKVGFDDNGKLLGIDVHVYEGLGYLENENIVPFFSGNIDSVTTPSAQFMEHVMEKVSNTLNGDAIAIKRANLYMKGQDNRWKKKSLAVTPIKFGMSYNYSMYTMSVMIYGNDGTVSVTSGGVECGQGLNTKVAQIVAYKLGIPVDMISIKGNDTVKNPNNASTGGSVTSEECCKGAAKCCDELIANMKPIKDKMTDPTWMELVTKCYQKMVVLKAEYTVAGTPVDEGGNPFKYFSYGTACTEVELDVLTGEYEINRVDIVYDCGESLNPAVDIGQVEGSFMMGIGNNTTEEVVYDPTTGKMINYDTWGYHAPTNKDIPVDFRVHLLKNAPNPVGFLRSKASGEPPLNMSCSVFYALQNCIREARKDAGVTGDFVFEPPATRDKVQELCMVKPNQFVI